ncbi:hypothetical protein EDC04DRAFT_2605964 [Pisolithus marmoratus]|nr:hypothetical protein EDC04DRAFT_2605964 [Pisolithus marmoratus]
MYVPLPRGDMRKGKELALGVTMGDLDVANARPQGGNGKTTEINEQSYVDEGVAEVTPDVVFIEESPIAATVVLATSGNDPVPRGRTMLSFHVVYLRIYLIASSVKLFSKNRSYLPDRRLIVKTDSYVWERIAKVVQPHVNHCEAQAWSRHVGTMSRRNV